MNEGTTIAALMALCNEVCNDANFKELHLTTRLKVIEFAKKQVINTTLSNETDLDHLRKEIDHLSKLLENEKARVVLLAIERDQWKARIKEYLPENCQLGWGERKFCNIRNGDGWGCQMCAR